MNYYTVGIEGMPRLLLEIEDPLGNFRKKLYPAAFKNYFEKNMVTFQAIENGYQDVVDKEQFLTNMANALVETADEKVKAQGKKNNQDKLLMDYNLYMAVYVLPAILEFHGQSSKPLTEKLLAGWKERFPKTNIQAATYEHIEHGFHRKFCYITTAVCETFGKPDDCYELTILRNYRDGYLMDQPEGEEIIKEYYDVAPTIVKHINKNPEKSAIYQDVWDKYLHPCIQMIEDNKNEECKELYIQMVRDLQTEYFYNR